MTAVLASDADLLREIVDFCAEKEMAITTFGRQAVGDPSLVKNMRMGRSPRLKTADRVRLFMANYQPAQRAA